MRLTPGMMLGPYEVLAPLGAGGMGEVYRARDRRLGREVAMKVLPQQLSANAEIRARFEREAKTVSGLNHPNICVLHDVGREGDTDYIVMELVDGETLAARLGRGPLPVHDVLKVGAQVADALERAHRAGVVHRDLKPGNVMLSGASVKLMDFGLARATGLGNGGSGSGVTSIMNSPTVAGPLTAEGTIVGTFQYMAPEQLEGREADSRSDLWALGCVLYEMATGTRAFDGTSQASVIAAIMQAEPRPLRELQPASPASLDALIRECLVKDPEERRQSAGDIRRELKRLERGDVAPPARPPHAGGRRHWLVAGVAVAVAVVAAIVAFIAGRGGPAPDPERIAFAIPAPPGSRFRFKIEDDGTRLGAPAISRDGRHIVFGVVDSDGQRTLMLRSLDHTEASVLAGSTDGLCPFWSPDSRMLGFFSDGKVRKASVAGGAPVALADAHNPRGASWNHLGTILYAPTANSGLFQVSENGGMPRQVTFPDTTLPDMSHRWPVFLSDDEHFLFLVWTNNAAVRDSLGGIYLGSLRSSQVTRLHGAPSSAAAVGGEILFASDGSLVRAKLDVAQAALTDATPTDQRVDWDPSTGLAIFGVSENGTLMCRETSELLQTRLVWFDRAGAPADTIGAAANHRQLVLARDGSGAAACIGSDNGDGDIWLFDFARGLTSRFTNSPADENDPTISADGSTIAYASDVEGPFHVFMGPADRSRPPARVSPPSDDWNLLDSSADGRFLLMATSTHLWVHDVQQRRAHPWHAEAGSLRSAGCFSPDSRWIAFGSSESGRDEIYVRPYPGPGGQWQVSTGGGFAPSWRSDGREIVYVDLDGELMAVQLDTRGGFQLSTPRRMFRVGPRTVWAASPDHTRFLVAVRSADAVDPPIKVITAWLVPRP